MLLTFGFEKPPEFKEEHMSVVTLPAPGKSEEAPKPSSAEQAEDQPKEQPVTPQPTMPTPPLPPQAIEPRPTPPIPTPTTPSPSPPVPKIGVRLRSGPVSGPPNTGGSSASRDTERVGTAPNGEPLYAAAWYREPTDGELRGYLSTASGPGWGLIACRTAPDYRVEDCVGLDEYPNGSQMNRAVLAAAWQFRVRPPRVGGQSMVGSWVRIRIDYGTRRR
jgi:protein TonB